MASLNWNDIAPVSTDDAKQQILQDLDDSGFDTTSWQEGSAVLEQVELTAELKSKSADIAVFFKSAFIPSSPDCTGDALAAASSGFYGNTKGAAVNAQHLVTLACAATSGPYTINTGDLVASNVAADLTQSTFRNVDGNSVVYPCVLASGTSKTFLFESEVAGQKANVGEDLTNTGSTTAFALVTTLAGVTITSHSIYRSGIDEESDTRLLQRDQLKWAGNLGELQFIDDRVKALAMQAAVAVTTVAVDSTNPRGQGTFDVYVAELDSTASANDVSLVQLRLDLMTFGRNNTPKTCLVYPAPELPLDITGTVYFTGSDVATVQAAVEAGLLDFVRSTPCGGWSYFPGPQHIVARNDIESVIRVAVASVASSKVTVVLSVPAADVSVSLFGKVIRGNWSLTYILTNG